MSTPSELFDLSGRAALVTGATRGIGRWIAQGLAEAGADIVVVSRKQDACDEVAAEITSTTGRRAVPVACDVADTEQIDALVERAIRELGRLDVLVNNAATVWAADTLAYPLKGWDKVFAVNVRGLFYLSQQVALHMRAAGSGSIVNISSINAQLGAREEHQPIVAYNASKGAVDALTRDLAAKLAPYRIRVNSLAPGSFDTDLAATIKQDPDGLAGYLTTIPMGRLGGADDVKGAAVFLASEASRYITGQTLVVDGGCAAQGGPHVPFGAAG
ncbi:MAG: glucose 1-dehydrogenase [Deltaproteobacteria bacterium]|nr:glucose 1-dehydrogenase [Deltaproteobacteria bacterium]